MQEQKKDNKQDGEDRAYSAHDDDNSDEEQVLFVVPDDPVSSCPEKLLRNSSYEVSNSAVSSHELSKNTWYLDSGCSSHMSGHKEWFVDLDEERKSSVRFADNSIITADGVGKILVKKKNGRKAYIPEVLYVPSVKHNLISLGQLLEKGYSWKTKGKKLLVYDPKHNLILQSVLSGNKTFRVDLDTSGVQCLSAKIEEVDKLWHLRYGHLHFKGLHQLHHEDMVKGLPLIKGSGQVCEDCLLSKQPRNSFANSKPVESKVALDVVFSDVCGPFEVT